MEGVWGVGVCGSNEMQSVNQREYNWCSMFGMRGRVCVQ